jgi:hypothetical protein
MKPLWSSPCSRAGLSTRDDPFPCLHAGWGDRRCPMNDADCRELREREGSLYRIGYIYGAWIVRQDVLGLSPLCSLTYFREKPTPEELHERYGNRVLHVAEAIPCPEGGGGRSSDHEVLADAAD